MTFTRVFSLGLLSFLIAAFALAPSAHAVEITNDLGMEFVLIPAGSFFMGSDREDNGGNPDETPSHRVALTQSFYLGKYEVTQRQWNIVMDANPSSARGDSLPVENISWDDASDFIARLNRREGTGRYRLPTEAEWEFAARAGTTTSYFFGNNDDDLGLYAWTKDNSGDGSGDNSGRKTHPVGGKLPNPWGLFDITGNVWEWVADIYDKGYYSVSPDADPKGPSDGDKKMVRGCSFLTVRSNCRVAFRGWPTPDIREDLGFRVAFTAESATTKRLRLRK
ncbi:MAG: formylglycine-generating enzyme family protein [Deltaproteobacteria bacterium]|jgi:formylglycine-generating enzyme required for sulfatase activity|nr:formylglycine-generating enzyme family protein [Deltaproteobacteria bacterium]